MDEYDFSPPTPEELKAVESEYDFSPPTEVEKQKYLAQPEEPSTLGDVATGIGQGLFLGLPDEALAAMKAVGEVATTEKQLKDLPSLYRQYQQIEQEKVAKARERSPFAFTAGELAGGFIPAAFTGGATAAAELGTLARVARGAKLGAGIGAVQAFGTAEAPIEKPFELAKETAKGAVVGGTLGGLTEGLISAGKSLYQGSKELIPEVELLEKAAETGKKNVLEGAPGYTSPASETFRVKQVEEAATGATRALYGAPKEGAVRGEKVGGLVNAFGSAIDDVLNQSDAVISPDSKLLSNLKQFDFGLFTEAENDVLKPVLAKLKKGVATPKEANDARRILRDAISENRFKNESVKLKNPISDTNDWLSRNLGSIPGFKQANASFDELLSKTSEAILKNAPEEFRTEFIGTEITTPARLEQMLEKIISKAKKPGEIGLKYRTAFRKFQENVNELYKKYPDMFKKAGIESPDQIIAPLEEAAKQQHIALSMGGYAPETGGLKRSLGAVTPRAIALRSAQVAGMAKGTAEAASRKIYGLPDKALMSIADSLAEHPRFGKIAESLKTGLESFNVRSKNAALFTLMQHPEAREAIFQIYPDLAEKVSK